MDMDIDIRQVDDYVVVDVTGTFTKANALTLFEKVLIYTTVTQTTKLLIDVRKLEGDVLMELFALSKKATELQDEYSETTGRERTRKAYLFDPERYNQEMIKGFVYDKNRDNFVITMDHDEAIEFLRGQ